MLKSDDAMESILKGVVETQEEFESEVPEGDGEKKEDQNRQTVRLQASEVNKKRPVSNRRTALEHKCRAAKPLHYAL
jgi:hypothetical protein